MSIFDGYIYPADSDILYLEYFKDYFEAVFVCFNPFFKMSDEYTSSDYPSDLKAIKLGKTVTWKEVKEGCNFNSFNELAIALETSIGALNRKYEDKELEKILRNYCEENRIFDPSEGFFNALIHNKIKKIFEINGCEKIITQDEFGYEKDEIPIMNIGMFNEALEETYYLRKNIYSPDKKILFTIDWDSHYFLFCSSREIIEKALKETKLEGFFSNEKTCHHWELYT